MYGIIRDRSLTLSVLVLTAVAGCSGEAPGTAALEASAEAISAADVSLDDAYASDPRVDNEHCGATRASCTAGQGCFGGACTSPAAMSMGRVAHTAVTGPDRRIYVFGGVSGAGTPQTSAEAFDPRTNVWTTLAPMPSAHLLGTALVGSDGHIYVVGGLNADGASFSDPADYDPKLNVWTQAPWTFDPRYQSAAASLGNGTFLVLGGFDANNVPGRTSVLKSGAAAWLTAAPMPTARFALGAAVARGQLYAVGGGVLEDGGADPQSLRLVEVYHPASNRWTNAPSMKEPRFEPGVATGVRDGRIYAMGGHAANHVVVASAEVLEPNATGWKTLAPMANVRAGLAAVGGADGRIYAIGGHAAHDGEAQATMDVYNPRTRAWAH